METVSENKGRRAVLHIGIHKTGTSAIQGALYGSRQELLRCGILYPSLAANLSKHMRTMFQGVPSQDKVMRRRTNNLIDVPALEELKGRFDADLRSSDWRILMLSAEALDTFDIASARAAVRWLRTYAEDVIVVAYIRHPVDWVRSAVQQRLVATNVTLSRIYGNLPRPGWRRKLMPWINTVGVDNFRLVSYDDARRRDDLLGALFDAGGVERSSVPPLPSLENVNASISLEAVLMMESFNRLRISENIGGRRAKSAMNTILKTPGRRFQLPRRQAENARARSRADVEWLQDTFAVDWFSDVHLDSPMSEPERIPRNTVDAMVNDILDAS